MWIKRRGMSSLSYFVLFRITAVSPALNTNIENWVCAVCLHGPTHRSGMGLEGELSVHAMTKCSNIHEKSKWKWHKHVCRSHVDSKWKSCCRFSFLHLHSYLCRRNSNKTSSLFSLFLLDPPTLLHFIPQSLIKLQDIVSPDPATLRTTRSRNSLI